MLILQLKTCRVGEINFTKSVFLRRGGFVKLSHKHSNAKESHGSLLQVDGSGHGAISCGGVVGGAAMSVSRRGKEMRLRVNSPKQKRWGRGFKTLRPHLFFISQKPDLFMFLYQDSQTPPRSLHHKRRALALVTANSILYLDSSRFCESLAKVFKDTLFSQSPGVCAHEPLPLPVPSRVVLLNTRI